MKFVGGLVPRPMPRRRPTNTPPPPLGGPIKWLRQFTVICHAHKGNWAAGRLAHQMMAA